MDTSPAASPPTSSSSLQALAARSLDAWNAHDVDAILQDWSDDVRFVVHDGSSPAHGRQEARSKVTATLLALENLHFEPSSTLFGPDFFTAEYTVTGVQAAADGTTHLVSVPLVDIVRVRDGCIVSKTSYVGQLTVEPVERTLS